MKKILKAITFLSLAMCLMLNTSVVYAGGRDETIQSGNKLTVYASHKKLEELVELEKQQDRREKLIRDGTKTFLGLIPGLGPVVKKMAQGFEFLEKCIKYFCGDGTFLTSCRDKSANNGQRGCIMKYTFLQHDEGYDEWWPDSCELQ